TARRGAAPTGRGRSQTPDVSRPRVPARQEAPGKIETLAPKPEPEETVDTPSAELASSAEAENIETAPPPIEATQAEQEADEIADSGLSQPEDEGGALNEQRRQ